MIIGSASGPRAAWYDRNPLAVLKGSQSGAVAPAGTVTLFSYTVPAGRNAFISSALARVIRVTAAAPVGEYVAWVKAIHGVNYNLVASARLLSNNVADTQYSNIGTELVLSAGDTVFGQYLDASTGGTVDYEVSCAITEFDG